MWGCDRVFGRVCLGHLMAVTPPRRRADPDAFLDPVPTLAFVAL